MFSAVIISSVLLISLAVGGRKQAGKGVRELLLAGMNVSQRIWLLPWNVLLRCISGSDCISLFFPAALIALKAWLLSVSWKTCSQDFHCACLMVRRHLLARIFIFPLAVLSCGEPLAVLLAAASSLFALLISGVHHTFDFSGLGVFGLYVCGLLDKGGDPRSCVDSGF